MSHNKMDQRIRINVGGVRFETFSSTLEKFPGTRLSILANLKTADESYDKERNEFFFDRHPGVFTFVLHFFRTEELHTDQNICGNIIKEELEYWGLTELDIESCCWGNYSKFKENRETLTALDDNFIPGLDSNAWETKMTNFQKFKIKMWQFLEDPNSSRGAKVFAVVSMFFALLSIGTLVLETHNWFRVAKAGAVKQNDTFSPKAVTSLECCCKLKYGSYALTDSEPHQAMVYIDYLCVAYFTLEFLMRLFFAPNKLEFIKEFLTIIDILCLIPHYTSIIIETVDPGSSTGTFFRSILALRAIRVLRIFKLMKHYTAFKILVYTIKVSTKELMLIIIFLFTGVLLFATVIHHVEQDTFDSIPVGFWWALVTMTTVGYGDKVPLTEFGYMVGSLCVMCGVLTVAFTVPIVVNNFTLYYSHAQSRIKLPPSKQEFMRKRTLTRAKAQKTMSDISRQVAKDRQDFAHLAGLVSPRSPQQDDEDDSQPEKLRRVVTMDRSGAYETLRNDSRPPSSVVSEAKSGSSILSDISDRVRTVSESVSIKDVDLPGTPETLDSTQRMEHQRETEQLLQELAESTMKKKEERKRQLDLINSRREHLRQSRSEGRTPRVAPSPGGAAKPTLK